MTSVLCRTTLNYLSGTAGEVTIEDGRTAHLPGWEECGFELLAHDAAVEDWGDDAEIERLHYPEIVALAEKLSGCEHALLSSHIKRNPGEAAKHGDLAPITFVHSDFAESYGDLIRARYRDPGPAERDALDRAGLSSSEAAGAARVLILQFWRNIGPAKMDLPLAFCDARTVPRGDVQPIPVTNYAGGGFDFEALGVLAPSEPGAHAWYAFDEMHVDETVAFRTYDTARVADGRPYWTPHSAFRDPTVPLGSPSRSSIELRATCLFL
jgi:hypothetical protein